MYSQIISDIKSLKIQGAINVAKEAVRAFKFKLDEVYNPEKDIKVFISELLKIKEELFSLRATEPCLRNALNYIFFNLSYTLTCSELKSELDKNIIKVNEHFINTNSMIKKFGSKKIQSGMTIFTHCHASTVTGILIEAKNQKKDFNVHNTETRPRFQGRLTAKELSDNGIKVEHFVDSAGRYAIKKCDIVLLGADAILSDGTVINKIGSEMFAEIAYRYDIPIYICTDSWKFDPNSIFGYDEEIEIRDPKEIWTDIPKNVTINNYAFEKINPNLISGIITELGIFKPFAFVDEVLKENPWMLINRNKK